MDVFMAARNPAPPPPEPPPPPKDLQQPERQIWIELNGTHMLDVVARSHLTMALTALQRARECREIVARDGKVIVGRRGRVQAHPLIASELACFRTYRLLMRLLKLEP